MRKVKAINSFKQSKAAKMVNIALKGLAITALSFPLMSIVSAEEQTGKDAKNEFEVITVKGIIGSLSRSQAAKRLAPNVIDSISMEDLGKYTDDSVIDALQRVPGVQIQRDETGGGGSYSSIRGLGPAFVNATINGRVLYGTGSEGSSQMRSFSFDAIPTEIIGGLDVHKSPTAGGVESGIGGAIDLKTIRPLNVRPDGEDDFFGVVSGTAVHDSASGETGPRLSALLGNTFLDNTLGAYISVVHAKTNSARGNLNLRSKTANINLQQADGSIINKDVSAISYDENPITEDLVRDAFASGLQWLGDDVEVNVDAIYTSYAVNSTRQRMYGFTQLDLVQTGGLYDANKIGTEPLAFGANGDLVDVITSYAPGARLDDDAATVKANSGQQRYENKADSLILGANVEWNVSDNSTLIFDVFSQDIEHYTTYRRADFYADVNSATLGYDFTNGQTVGIGYEDALSSADYQAHSIFAHEKTTDIQNSAISIDFIYELGGDFFTNITSGFKFQSADIEQKTSPRPSLDLSDPTIAATFIDALLTNEAANTYGPSVIGHLRAADFFATADAFPEVLKGSYFTGNDADLSGQFNVLEDVTTFYVETSFEGESFSGNFGVQVVNAEYESEGIAALIPGLTTADGSFTEVLPSLNINYSLSDDLNLRFAASRVQSRPEPTELVPGTSFSVDGIDNEIVNAKTGNAKLTPYLTDQVDLTLEWYTENDGAVYVSAFYKYISDFILVNNVPNADITFPEGYAISEFFFATQPINASDGSVAGLEFNVNQPLPMIVEGLGLIFNYTYVDSELTDIPNQEESLQFPGASKNNYNASVYYEANGFSAKVSYTYRDRYLRALAGTDLRSGANRYTDETGVLDVTLTYSVTDNLDLRLSGVNLTGEDRADYAGTSNDLSLSLLTNHATYSFGATYSF